MGTLLDLTSASWTYFISMYAILYYLFLHINELRSQCLNTFARCILFFSKQSLSILIFYFIATSEFLESKDRNVCSKVLWISIIYFQLIVYSWESCFISQLISLDLLGFNLILLFFLRQYRQRHCLEISLNSEIIHLCY